MTIEAYDWDIERCRAYAEQLRDKTRANTAEHAAQAIEWLLAQLASHQIIGKNQEPMACQHKRYSIDVTEQIGTCIDCGSEGRMRFVVDDTHPQPKREPLTMFETEKLAKRFGVEWTTRIHALCNEAAHGITSDMKQEHVAKTEKQRHEWVGLTDEEIEDCYKQGGIGRAIQMLKEKNT